MDALTCPSCGAISLPGPDNDALAGIALRLSQALGNRYRIERELGRGGMAVVFLAQDLRHTRQVAIKVLLPEPSRVLGVDRFLREIHIAAQLNHPHILPLHDSGEADGLLFYVMPYVEADSLRRRLTRTGPLPVAEAVRIAMEVADGLEYAHRLGVVHRDIKPENILLTQSHAVIADFGIARPVAKQGATITTVGISLGTPDYMSPEQAAADPALDHRTDIYALGCTLYEMLTGKSPFPGPTPFAQARRHLADPVPSARALRHEVPAALDAAVRRAMAKVPADRFASAAEFGEVLGGFIVATGRRVVPSRPMVVRHWRTLAAVVAVLAGAGALLIGRGRASVGLAERPPLRVVVRPFGDGATRLVRADELTERLTDLLRTVRPALDVMAYPAVAGLRGAGFDTLQARFRPERTVSGQIESAGDSLRVHVEVVNSATKIPVKDTTYVAGQGTDAVAALAVTINAYVRRVFSQELENQKRRAMVRSDRVWARVEQAESLMVYASSAVESGVKNEGFRALDRADSLLQEARRLDPKSDLITLDKARHADIGSFYSEYFAQRSGETSPGRFNPDEARRRVLRDLDELIRKRPQLAAAYELRGSVKEGLYRTQRKDSLLDGALADYQLATDLDPTSASAWEARGSAYASKGQYRDALFMVEIAMKWDIFQARRPHLLRNKFDYAVRASRYSVADSACSTGAVEPIPQKLRPMFDDCDIELWSREATEDRTRAAKARTKADSLSLLPDAEPILTARREMWVAEIFAQAGLRERANAFARPVMADAPAAWQPLLLPEAAYLRFLLGDPDSAVAIIAATIHKYPWTKRTVFPFVPWFRSLRSDPRFIALLDEGAAQR